jgi:hypothetical protein
LKGVRLTGIKFVRVEDTYPELRCYYDASNKGAYDGRALMGFITFLGTGPVDWRSYKAPHKGQSSTHNEYQSQSASSKAVAYQRNLCIDFGMGFWFKCQNGFKTAGDNGRTILVGDNKAAVALAREHLITMGNRFFDRELHFAKDAFENFLTDPRWDHGTNNPSDLMTKSTSRPIFKSFHLMSKGYGEGLPPIPPRARD